MTFGDALAELKLGARIARDCWGDRWVCLIIEADVGFSDGELGPFPMAPCLGLKTEEGDMQPGWLPSQPDMFATDWRVL